MWNFWNCLWNVKILSSASCLTIEKPKSKQLRLPLSTFLKYGSKLMVKGRNMRRSDTNKSCLVVIRSKKRKENYFNVHREKLEAFLYLCNCKKASNFLSSRSNSSNGSESRKFAKFMRTLKTKINLKACHKAIKLSLLVVERL